MADIKQLQIGTSTYNIQPSLTSTDKAIARYNGTTGTLQNSTIIIEDVTNSRDNSAA